jgi:hypothetical protein
MTFNVSYQPPNSTPRIEHYPTETAAEHHRPGRRSMTTIHTIVKQLTEDHTHRQPYRFEGDMSSWDTHHTTEVPPLIEQLNEAEVTKMGDLSGATFGSRPAASIEALDTLIHIDAEASAWVRKLGHDDPGTTIACVRKVYALAASAQFCNRDKPTIEDRKAVCCDVHRIERDMRRWWTQARIASGWDSPAWAPNNTCPVDGCGERRSLRIRVEDRTAFCTNCREVWPEGTIGILAEHIRAENGEELVS